MLDRTGVFLLKREKEKEVEKLELISIIVPCYNEEKALPYFLEKVKILIENMANLYRVDFEIFFINDGSIDRTLDLLRTYSKANKKVHYISFSRNFGKEAAMYAGLQAVKGDYVVIMDADLQHPPAMIEEMYTSILNKQYDIAAARRVSRKGEPAIRSFLARSFYKIINKISKVEFVDGASDFRMLSRAAVNAILQLKEYNRFSKGIFGWIGFRTKWIEYENVERVAGETKWSFWKLFSYSIEGIVGFSTIPLSLSSIMGCILCLIAAMGIVFIVVNTLVWGNPVDGFPTLVCLLLLIEGSLQLSLGIIGQYLSKAYLETKKRPIYIIQEHDEEF